MHSTLIASLKAAPSIFLPNFLTGPQKLRGARRKFDGKVNLSDIDRLTFVQEVEANVYLYTAVVLI